MQNHPEDLLDAPRASTDPIVVGLRDTQPDPSAVGPAEEREHFLAALVDSSSDAIFTIGPDILISTWNPGAERLFGYPAAEAVGKSPSMLIHGDGLDEYRQDVSRLAAGEFVAPYTRVRVRRDGTIFHASVTLSLIRGHDDRARGVLVIARDVSAEHERQTRLEEAMARAVDTASMLERRVAERTVELQSSHDELVNSERALAALSLSNRALVRATDENLLMQEVCDAIVAVGGYRMAWVGAMMHDGSHRIAPVASSGIVDGYLDEILITWDDSASGRGPGGLCVRELGPVVSRETLTDTRLEWREQATARGYRSLVALPLLDIEGAPFGILVIYSGESDAFDAKEIDLLEKLSADLGFGVTTLRCREIRSAAEVELKRTNLQLEQMVYQVAEAMGRIVEARDPYTKGHEVRVSRVAELLATEMGKSAVEVAAVGMASLLHDIGKLRVPAEILSKPGRLSEAEFSLIQEHSRGGYDILADVTFPWPVADIVLQHHERMDGSGYPQSLVGDAILPAARILAVADVVEAMASFRPYRPALGLPAAMAEVTGHAERYDSDVVAACVRLHDSGRLIFLESPEAS